MLNTLIRAGRILAVVVVLGYFGIQYACRGGDGEQARRGTVEVDSEVNMTGERSLDVMKVMTLNLAHGRKDGTHQALAKTSTIRSNLDDISSVIARESPWTAALQEADGPSIWSGNFDHVQYVASGGGLAYFFRGAHVNRLKLSYGTAILSKSEISDEASHRFAPSPPTLSKGFVVGSIQWPGHGDRHVDIVSVHLDFSRTSIRRRQLDEMTEVLSKRHNPLVVMGDFNCKWEDGSPLPAFVDALNLKAFEATSSDYATFPRYSARIDWILISEPLEFKTHRVLEDTLSDHRGVVAELEWTER